MRQKYSELEERLIQLNDLDKQFEAKQDTTLMLTQQLIATQTNEKNMTEKIQTMRKNEMYMHEKLNAA